MKASSDSGTLVFKDSFDDEGSYLEHFNPAPPANWREESGALVVAATGGSAKSNLPLEPDFRVEADIALLSLESGQPGAFAGFLIDGSLFVVRAEGFYITYTQKGGEHAEGGLTGREIEPGKSYHLAVTRRALDGNYVYSCEVDGEPIREFTQTPPDEDPTGGGLALYSARMGARFDNVAVYQLPSEKRKP